jgi:hypothetical protein
MRGAAMVNGVSEAAYGTGAQARLSALQSACIVYATSLLIVLADMADSRLFHADVDDRLRELQIRLLLSAKGAWYDLTLPFVMSPEPYLSPWSRLVDLPYVVIAKGLSLAMPADEALQAAFWIWPPIMLALVSLLAAFVATRLMDGTTLPRRLHMAVLVLMTVFMSIAVLEFAPGRIDHHNVQIVTLLAVAAGAIRWDGWGGLLLGVASALSVVVGLECLPFVVLAYGALVGAFVLDVRGARGMLGTASLGMVVATAVSAVAFLGVPGSLSVQCDAFSAPYIVLMMGGSAILGLCSVLTPASSSAFVRLTVLAVPSAGILAIVGFGFPACLSGPYAMIDPLSRLYWFDRIWQEHNILYFYRNSRLDLLALLGLMAAVLAAVVPLAMRKVRSSAVPWLAVYGIAIGAFLLTILLTRYIRFPSVLVPLFIPAFVAFAFQESNRALGRRAMIVALTLCMVAVGGGYFVVPAFEKQWDAVDYMSFDDCAGQDFSVLATVTPGRIAAPNGLSLPIVFSAPDGFSVAAIPFHRAAPGMKRMYEAFLSSDPIVRKQALAPFDYVAVCQFPLPSEPAFAPLYAALSAGKDWPGLVRIVSPAETNFQLFRIDHAALR